MLRHHRLLELYLAEPLGVPWDRVHDEAEVLEHVLSEELEELIAAKLGNPTHDPHGDPIPTRRPRDRRARDTQRLADARARRRAARFVRVSDSDPEMLRYLAERGIAPGDALRGRRQAAVRRPAVRRASATTSHVLGGALARAMRVEVTRVSPPPAGRRRAAVAPRPPRPSPARCERLRAARPPARHAARCSARRSSPRVAYVDPGNFATNIAGGAKYGYLLLWVILAANLMAMLIQNLSAKIGIATGRNLPELCREHFPRPVTWGLWVQAELIAMATDLAEFVGAAIALNLLFGVPLLPGRPDHRGRRLRDPRRCRARGYRRFELVDRRAARRDPARLPLRHAADRLRRRRGAPSGFVPGFDGTDCVLLATGILGATVMPHVIYLHSALTQNRIRAARRRRAPRAAALPARRRDRSRWASPAS